MVSNDEVTAADIARIAGVGRAAVSNWRRRHPDFPAPVGGPPNSPTFALADVEAWLAANGRLGEPGPAQPRPSRHRKLDSGLATVMAALLPPLSRGTVLDPACSDGSQLVAAAERFGPRLRYVGMETDSVQVDLARDALSEAGARTAELVSEVPEAQLAPLLHTADAVISISPPAAARSIEGISWEYGQPSRNDYPLAWVQICLSYLKPGGTAVIAVPFAAAVRASGRRVRSELLRAGVLTHVIGLPEAMFTPGAAPWQIWVLTQPVGRPAYVLHMVDLMDREPHDLPRDATMWEAIFIDPSRTRDVPSIELLDEDVLLVPAAYLTAEARDVAPEYAKLRSQYTDAVHRLSDAAPVFTPGGPRFSAQLMTIGDLARLGAVTFTDPDTIQPGDVFIPSGSGDFDAYVFDGSASRNVKAGSALRCDPQVVDPYFLACFLRSETNRRKAAGTLGGTFRLDVRRARVPRMPLAEQRRYGETFRQLTAFTQHATEVAAAATEATRTAIDGLTSGAFAPIAK